MMNYLNTPPLDVPPGYDPIKAFRRGVERGEWSDMETAARRVCRLIIEAAKKSQPVRRWLLATQRIGSHEWNKLMISIGREVPSVAKGINKIRPGVPMLSWAVANAAKVIREEKQTEHT